MLLTELELFALTAAERDQTQMSSHHPCNTDVCCSVNKYIKMYLDTE